MWQGQVAHSYEVKPRTNDVLTNEVVTFEELLLSEQVLSGLKKSGFYKPSPIQLKAIPLGRCGLDLVVQAKSGTGKTCVFTVIALESFNPSSSALQVIILAPTREIALQIHGVILSIGQDVTGLNPQVFIGGTQVSENRTKAKKCNIAIGSPGRVKQLIELGVLITDNVRMFVLDEADKLVEEGSFQQQINWIYSSLPENKQIIALSATYPETLAEFLTRYMREPTYARLDASNPALLGLRQYFIAVQGVILPHLLFEEKTKHVVYLLSSLTFQQVLIFSNYHSRAESICEALNCYGWPSTFISGNMEQTRRTEAINKLKLFKCRVLISTDLTSRGIDARNVDLVINMDIPPEWETYMHRIGRAGRFGSRGVAVSLVTESEEEKLHSLAARCNTSISPITELICDYDPDQINGEGNVTAKKASCILPESNLHSPNIAQHPVVEKTCPALVDQVTEEKDKNGFSGMLSSSSNSSCGDSFSEETSRPSSVSCSSIHEGSEFPFQNLNNTSTSLPKIPCLKELIGRSQHLKTNTHYLKMTYNELKADFKHFDSTGEFADPPASVAPVQLNSLFTDLSSKLNALKVDVPESNTEEAVNCDASGEPLEVVLTTDKKNNSLSTTENTSGVKNNIFENKRDPSSDFPSHNSCSTNATDTAKQTDQRNRSKIVRKRNPLCGAAALDILKHWKSVEKVTAHSSPKEVKNNPAVIPANHAAFVEPPTSLPCNSSRQCFIPEERAALPPGCSYAQCNFKSRVAENKDFCNNELTKSYNVTSNDTSSESTGSYYSSSSSDSDADSESDRSDSSDYSDSSFESHVDGSHKYGPGVGAWRPVDDSKHYNSLQRDHPIFPPPLLLPFTPTGHSYFPSMYAYNNVHTANEAVISNNVYQFALQHARNQVANL